MLCELLHSTRRFHHGLFLTLLRWRTSSYNPYTQLIDKGIYHHHWETKIVAVVQDVVYENLHNKIAFPELSIDQSNVVFLQYAMVLTKTSVGPRYQLKLKKVTGTQHNALMMSSFYKKAPPKEKFCQRILTVYKADHK